MNLLVLAMLAAAADSAPVGVVVDSKRPGTEHDADELVSLIYLALIDAGVPRELVILEGQGFLQARQCEGRARCLRSLAQVLGPGGLVVGIDVGRVANDLVAHVQAVGATGEPIAELDLSASNERWRATAASAVPAFAREVAGKRSAAAPKPQTVALVPAPAPAAAELTGSPLPGALKWPAAAGAGVSFITSAVLLGVGASAKATYDRSLVEVDGMRGTTLTAAEAQRLGSQVNLQLSFALGTAVLGALLAAAAAWLFVRG